MRTYSVLQYIGYNGEPFGQSRVPRGTVWRKPPMTLHLTLKTHTVRHVLLL